MIPSDYHHGGELAHEFKRLGVIPRPVNDFSVNLSPLGPPKPLLDAWPQFSRSISQYPDKSAGSIQSYYQQIYGLEADRVVPLNGSIEGIYLWPKGLNIKKALLPTPCFFDYHGALKMAGVEVTVFPLSLDQGFQCDQLGGMIGGHDAVILGSPNNPTGRGIDKERLQRWVQQFPGTQFLVDQAFVELGPDPDRFRLFDLEEPNLWLLHSLTKEYAIAGLRAGALICPPCRSRELSGLLPPWRIGGAVLEAVSLLAEQQDYREELKRLLDRERVRLIKAFEGLGCVQLVPTDANFFLGLWLGRGGLDDLLRRALEAGFALRDARNFSGLDGPYFRFAIKKAEDNEQLIQFFYSNNQ